MHKVYGKGGETAQEIEQNNQGKPVQIDKEKEEHKEQ